MEKKIILNKKQTAIKNFIEFNNFDNNKLYYDILDKPGDISKAKLHAKANMIYNYDKLKPGQIELCDDCYCPVPINSESNKLPLYDLCVNPKDFSCYGLGVYLYFFYIKILTFILFILVLMSSVSQIYFSYSYYSKYLKEYCYNNEKIDVCKVYTYSNNNIFEQLSYFNFKFLSKLISTNNQFKLKDITLDINFINFLVQITLFIINILTRITCYNLFLESDLLNITPEDFTLMISNIPKNSVDAQNSINSIVDSRNIKIYDIVKTYNLTEYYKLKNIMFKNNKLISKMIFTNRNELTKYFGLIKYNRKDLIQISENTENKLKKFINKIDSSNDDDYKTDTAFIVFKDTFEYNEFKSLFPTTILGTIYLYIKYLLSYSVCRCIFRHNDRKELRNRIKLICRSAPEPTDVLWENLSCAYFERYIRVFFIYLINILLLAISFMILYFITISQKNIKKSQLILFYILSFIFSISIIIINFLINKAIEALTKLEKNMSYTDYYMSYSFKLMIAWFLNTAVLPITVVYITNSWDERRGTINYYNYI